MKLKDIRLVRILLTLGAMEFFGPILRDTNASHLLNPQWVGHARFHLMWNIVLWASLGIYSIYLLWGSKNITISKLYQVVGFQIMNAIAFWGASILGGLYDADIFDESIHVGIMNVNENIAVFTVLSILIIINIVLLKRIELSSKDV